jgi:cytochrome c553
LSQSITRTFAAALVGALSLLAVAEQAMAQTPPQAPPTLLPITLEGNVERGARLAETCSGCHAVPGSRNGYPPFHVPKLGGQNADYLEIALQGYRVGSRSHPTMAAQASSLADQDIADIAAYFASIEGEKEAGKSDAGADLVEQGRSKAVACVQCHGQEGVAAAAQWPNLAGQHQSYLVHAIRQYKSGERKDIVMGPMASGLDDQAIEELAAFFAAQPWLYTLDP